MKINLGKAKARASAFITHKYALEQKKYIKRKGRRRTGESETKESYVHEMLTVVWAGVLLSLYVL